MKTAGIRASAALALPALVLGMFGCSPLHVASRHRNINESFNLTPAEVDRMTRAGEAGDHSASYRLGQFYGVYLHDEARCIFWLRRAAQGGHTDSQLALGEILRASKNQVLMEEGLQWINRSAAAGNKHARERLRQLDYLASLTAASPRAEK